MLCCALWSCSSALRWDADYHVVQPGDTIYSIAFRYDIDQRDLRAWNRIDGSALIFAGQRLRLMPPEGGGSTSSGSAGTTQSSPASRKSQTPKQVGWQWPTEGAVIAGYGKSAKTRSGIDIGGKRGQPVRAASPGRVVYAGDGLPGYGHLLIVKHNNDFLSAYGHNERLLAKDGDQVAAGQKIASMGEGPGRRPQLHFEIRLRGEPVNPLNYLPKR
jgi:lipoprotein NlpD